MNFKTFLKEDYVSPYLIAEIGINHNGNLNIAKKLIDASFATNWHCVKFQKRNPDKAVPDNQKNKIRDTPWGKIKYIDYKHKIEFKKDQFDIIDEYCSKKPIDWSISVWDEDSLDFSKFYNLPFLKIPSALNSNLDFIERCMSFNKFIIISTGMVSSKEIDEVVDLFRKKNFDQFSILHCNSSYPTPPNEINLNVIPELIRKYDCLVGYSGHEINIEPSVIAVALGAKIIERHVTLDHNMWGTDQKSSLEVEGMTLLQKRIEQVPIYLGNKLKEVTPSEKIAIEKLKKI